MSARPLLLDARTAEEFAVSHLRGARRLPTGQPALRSLSVGPREADDRRVVVYCSLGLRSAKVVHALRSQGVSHVYNLRGGLFRWANEGRPLYRAAERVSQVHPYNRLWGVLLDR